MMQTQLHSELRDTIGVHQERFTSINLNVGSWRLSFGRRIRSKGEVGATYDRLSSFWDSLNLLGRVPSAYEHLFRRLRALGFLTGRIRNVLDCGTGTGALLAAWTRTVSDSSMLYAADMSLKMGVRARNALKALGQPVRFIVGDGEALPFDSCSMHLVMCAYALEHMDNPQAGVAEMSRVLQHSGLLLLIIMRAGLVDSALRMLWRYRLIPPQDVLAWLWDNNLEPLHIGRIGTGWQISRWLGLAIVARKAGAV